MDPKQNHLHQAKKSEEHHPLYPLNGKQLPKTTSSRQWSANKNDPRIVRAFAGKDRHSKVCTVKGLRDRRIRLSAPTAIQLYDLQDRLGLGQPSKVVDWLIEATKEEIDKLPPLPMIPQFHLPSDSVHHIAKNAKENQDLHQGFGGFVQQNLFPYQGLAHYNVQPWDSFGPNLTLSQLGGGFSLSSSQSLDDFHHHLNMANAVMIPSFPSYNIITSSVEKNSSVIPTTLRLIGDSPTRLNVKFRGLHSQVSDQEKS